MNDKSTKSASKWDSFGTATNDSNNNAEDIREGLTLPISNSNRESQTVDINPTIQNKRSHDIANSLNETPNCALDSSLRDMSHKTKRTTNTCNTERNVNNSMPSKVTKKDLMFNKDSPQSANNDRYDLKDKKQFIGDKDLREKYLYYKQGGNDSLHDIAPQSNDGQECDSTVTPNNEVTNSSLGDSVSRHETLNETLCENVLHSSRLCDTVSHTYGSTDRQGDHEFDRTRTDTAISYCTHSEAEECSENDFSLYISSETITLRSRRHSSGTSMSGLVASRRRRHRRLGTKVTDSFADECVCCCTIL